MYDYLSSGNVKPQIEITKLFYQGPFSDHQTRYCYDCLLAQHISNLILFPRTILEIEVIIFQELQPSSLSHVKFLLGEKVFQTLMIREFLNTLSYS